MRFVRGFILGGGWMAGIGGIVGALAVVASSFSAATPQAEYVSSLRSLDIAPAILVCWLSLPSLCVALGATLAALSPRRSWWRLLGEALLLIGVTAGAGLGWYMLIVANWPVLALVGTAMALAIAVALALIVGELGGERETMLVRHQESINGK